MAEFKRNLSAGYSVKPKPEPDKVVESEPVKEDVKPTIKPKTLSKAPSLNNNPPPEKHTDVIVTTREEVKQKKPRSRLWLKIMLSVVLVMVFLAACVFTAFFVINLINKKDMTSVYTNIIFKSDTGVSFDISECVYDFDSDTSYTTMPVKENDLKFKWKNQSEKKYEVQITFDRSKALRFTQYNLYNGSYTYEKLFDIDFVSNTPNFSSKFIYGDDGYYYFDMNSQSSDTYKIIFTIKFDIADYHDQFNGNDIDEIFVFEQSAMPDKDWGYYSYLTNK